LESGLDAAFGDDSPRRHEGHEGHEGLTYLKLAGHTVGLLLNFNVELLRHGMRRVLNG
jgi:hypothetical protein